MMGEKMARFGFSASSSLIFDSGKGWFYFLFDSDQDCSKKNACHSKRLFPFPSIWRRSFLIYSQVLDKEEKEGSGDSFVVLTWAETSEGRTLSFDNKVVTDSRFDCLNK